MIIDNQIKIYIMDIIDLSNNDKRIIKYIEDNLDEEKRLRILRLPKAKYVPKVVVDMLIRYLAEKDLGRKINKSDIIYNTYGKPYIWDSANFYFNISHSGSLITAITAEEEVGIDCERIDKKKLNISNEFFCESEKKTVINSIKKLYAINQIWTGKESITKLIGRGLLLDIRKIHIEIISEYKALGTFLGNKYFLYYITYKDYIVCICSLKQNSIIDKIQFVELKCLL